MKKLLVLAIAMIVCSVANAAPYLYLYPVTKGSSFNTSMGALFDSRFSNAGVFTNMAFLYHPLSSGSIIPASLQPYIPPESWALNVGGGFSGGIGQFGFGPGFNLLDSVRAWASNILKSSSNATLQVAGSQIAPGNGPLNLLVVYEPTERLIENGQFARNPLKFTNHWFIGPSYSF